MEQVLNLPYEDNIAIDAVVKIVKDCFPKASLKSFGGRLFLRNNFLVCTRFSVKGEGTEHKLFFKTKMNIWFLLLCLLLPVFGGFYLYGESGHMNETDYVVVGLSSLVPVLVYMAYLLLKIGLVDKAKDVFGNRLPFLMSNRVDYYFPTNYATANWKEGMKPVQVLVIAWGIMCFALNLLPNLLPVYVNYYNYYKYLNILSELLFLAISMVFMMKEYNHYWKIAKTVFMIYACWRLLCSVASLLSLWEHLSTPLSIVLTMADCCLLVAFACFFHRSLRNSSSLYLLKAAILWAVIYIPVYLYQQYFLSTDFSFDSSEYKIFSMNITIGYSVAGLVYIWGFVKSFATLPKHVPQGIDIKL